MTTAHRVRPLFLLTAVLCIVAACVEVEQGTVDLTSGPETIELFAPGVISTGMYERDMAIAPDGNEIIYTQGDYKQLLRCLVSVRKTGNTWGAGQILHFSGVYQDLEPFISPDGRTLFFASTRPVDGDTARTDYNLWKSERVDGVWSNPQPLDTLINSPTDEYYPSVSRNGNLYFTAVRENGIGKEDIYVSRLVDGRYQKPEVLDSNINSSTYEFNAFISPDEDVLIFGSYGRPDDLGGGDLYISKKLADGSWSPAIHPGPPINSAKLDYCPFIDYPRGVFYFTSERVIERGAGTLEKFIENAQLPGNGLGDIYRVRVAEIIK